MDKETLERARKALERQEKQFKRQNEYIKENYERQTVVFPKGTKQALKEKGIGSVNEFLNDYVDSFLDRDRKAVLEDLKKERHEKKKNMDN